MKTTNHNVQRLLLAVMLLGMAACTGDFADINRNPNEVTDEQLQANNYKIGTNLKTLQGLVVPTQEHMYQFLPPEFLEDPMRVISAPRSTRGRTSSRPSMLRPTGASGPS